MYDFRDIYVRVIYDYIADHDGEIILYRAIMDRYQMSYPTLRKRIKWLVKNRYIIKRGRRFSVLPRLT